MHIVVVEDCIVFSSTTLFDKKDGKCIFLISGSGVLVPLQDAD